jgi:hypothetical protein
LGVRLLVSTRAGLYLLHGDDAWKRPRRAGPMRGRHPSGPLAISRGGAILAAVASELYASRDGRHWTRAGALPAGMRCSCLASVGEALYAGTEPAALFRSHDDGRTWEEIAAVRQHPTASEWWGPVRLPLTQAVVRDPRDPTHLYVGVSVAGVLHGHPGASEPGAWEPRNAGITPMYPPGSAQHTVHRDVRHLVCVPATAGEDSGPFLLAAAAHGLYVSRDGLSWDDLDVGWARAGVCALAAAPDSGALFAVAPEDSATTDQPGARGQLTIYRSRDGARTWEPLTAGLPSGAGCLVPRAALVAGGPGPRGPAALYLGTSAGSVYWSGNEGDDWLTLATGLPGIQALLPLPEDSSGGAAARPSFVWPFSRR